MGRESVESEDTGRICSSWEGEQGTTAPEHEAGASVAATPEATPDTRPESGSEDEAPVGALALLSLVQGPDGTSSLAGVKIACGDAERKENNLVQGVLNGRQGQGASEQPGLAIEACKCRLTIHVGLAFRTM